MDNTAPTSEPRDSFPVYYVWQVAGKSIAVRLNLDLVDALLQEVMSGFGAVPRRGAEVGGILLGSVKEDHGTVIVIDGFERVPCEYRSGPSFTLSEPELQRLRTTIEAWKPSPGRKSHVVGYFRSHTRDGMGLSPEDIQIFNDYFPQPNAVALLVKPFATKASQAGFFFREGAAFRTESSYLEFPFRRRELGGSPTVRKERGAIPALAQPQHHQTVPAHPPAPPEQPIPVMVTPALQPTEAPPANKPTPVPLTNSVWKFSAFLLLLLGIALGFVASRFTSPETGEASAVDSYTLGVALERSGENVKITWDRSAPAIRRSLGGALVIRDGDSTRTVNLTRASLQNGSVLYSHVSDHITFRLEVFFSNGAVLSHTEDYIAGERPVSNP